MKKVKKKITTRHDNCSACTYVVNVRKQFTKASTGLSVLHIFFGLSVSKDNSENKKKPFFELHDKYFFSDILNNNYSTTGTHHKGIIVEN